MKNEIINTKTYGYCHTQGHTGQTVEDKNLLAVNLT